MRIGVIGAGGRLGRLVAARLQSAAASVVEVSREASWHMPSPPLDGFDAVVVCAPLPDPAIHAAMLDCSCHVVDVTVGTPLDEALPGLERDAVTRGRSLIAMAGLAPGLTGALAHAVLHEPESGASRAVVTLFQHPKGQAGRRGVRDMLDLLTAPAVRYRPRPVLTTGDAFTEVRMFDLLNGEPEVLGLHYRLELATGWSNRMLDDMVRPLAWLRRRAPRVYEQARDLVASRKAASAVATEEGITLCAVAVDAHGRPVRGRMARLRSDYGATAAIAAAAAIAAVQGQTPPGAGHLARFLSADRLLADPLVRPQVIGAEASHAHDPERGWTNS